MSLCKHLRAFMKQRSVCYTYYKLKKFPLLQEASCLEQCLGKPGRIPVLAPGETEVQDLTVEKGVLCDKEANKVVSSPVTIS